ncbi:MAG: NAD(+)/NADH kinase [Muribaculaceae bacterium]|nr:NAD(+)/NADH kinase [Muribaculaceae bacterium]
MKQVSLYGNTWQEPALGSIATLISSLRGVTIKIDIESRFFDWLKRYKVDLDGCRRVDTPASDCSMIISCGGDGTLLEAARWSEMSSIPLAGVNTGHLGFLTAWHSSDIDKLVNALVNDEFTVDNRTMLRVYCEALSPDVWPYALNDVSILKANSASMISVRTYLDNDYLTDYEADGLVVATPSGSTAYSLSAGGPILQPTVPGIVLTPVAPHSLTMRPLVVRDDSRICTETASRSGSFLLSIDGSTISLPIGTRVEIIKADYTLPLVCRKHGSFANALRDKLLWGIKGHR